MLIISMLLSITTGLWPLSAGAAGSTGEAGQAVQAGAAAGRTVALSPPDMGKLDPALAALLPGLVAAALESGGAYQVTPVREGAGWSLELSVSGTGPWRLSALAVPASGAVARGKISARKISFTGRGDLTRAVDDLAAQFDAEWSAADRSAAAGTGAGTGAHPVPLARALSPSTDAVDAYIKALAALRTPDAPGSAALLDRALTADPSFAMAAAHRVKLHLASGEFDEARAVAAKIRPRTDAEGSPLSGEILGCLRLILDGTADRALEQAEAMLKRAPHMIWAKTLRALALGGLGRHTEALDAWRMIAGAEPDDAAVRALLGRALMATGDFKMAAGELARARKAWPSNLILYTLEAECLARFRDTEGARAVVTAMKDYAVAHDLVAPSDALNPFLMLGSVDLLEGKFKSALARFDEASGMKSKSGAPVGPSDTLLLTVLEMRRDLVSRRDDLARSRQLDDAKKALDRYEASLSPDQRKAREMEIMRLRGLILIKEGDTVGAWKLVDEMRARAGEPVYSEYDEAYLSAVSSMVEDDVDEGLASFERAAAARGLLVDVMDLAQTQLALRKYDEARANFEKIEQDLESYAAPLAKAQGRAAHSDLILADPRLAAMVPIYQYVRARLAFETGKGAESRRYFDRMLKYLREPDEQFMPMVKEAVDRGASPE